MSIGHSNNSSKIGGKCVKVIQRYKYEEENVQYAIWLVIQKRWKLSFSHNGNPSKIGGKCSAEKQVREEKLPVIKSAGWIIC